MLMKNMINSLLKKTKKFLNLLLLLLIGSEAIMKNTINSFSEKTKKFLNLLLLLLIGSQYFFIPMVTSKTILIFYLLFLVNIKIGQLFYYLNIFNKKELLIFMSKITFPSFAFRIVITESTQLEILNLFFIYFLFTSSIFLTNIEDK